MLGTFLKKSIIAVFVFSNFLVVGCGINPVTGKREFQLVSERAEINIGKESYSKMLQSQGGKYKGDPELNRYVAKVGQRLAMVSDRPQLPYEFVVINDSTPNAWALPGGKIGVNRGLLVELENEAELAAVLGHEIVHAAARHTANRMQQGIFLQVGMAGIATLVKNHEYRDIIGGTTQLAGVLILQKYSRSHELEADTYGIEYMVRAGYDPYAAASLQEKFLKFSKEKKSNWLEGFFASHPPSEERLKKNTEIAENAADDSMMFVHEEEYMQATKHIRKTKKAYERYDKASALLKKGNVPDAEAYAVGALKVEPEEALFHGLLAAIKAEQGDLKEALRIYNKAIALDDEYFALYLQRGLVKKELGDFYGAEKDLKMSLQLLPTAQANYALGRAYMTRGKTKLAVKHFQVASESHSDAGKKAQRWLTKLDLPQNPNRYFVISLDLEWSDRVIITVKNNSNVDVEDVVVQLEYREPLSNGGYITGRRHLGFQRDIPSGAIARVSTHLGPYSSKEQMQNNIRVRILRVNIIEN